MSVSTLAKITFLCLWALGLSACQIGYLFSNGIEQVRILNSREKISKVLASKKLDQALQEKLKYSQKARDYAIRKGLNCKNNFKSYVELDRPYVSYLLTASQKDKILAKSWWFPIVGSFPYLGFFDESSALKKEEKLKAKDYDTYLRGVTAYSSLGWFDEPILSSMLRADKFSLAETIFHECFHGSYFIKNNLKDNERLATFFGYHFLLRFLDEQKELKEIGRQRKIWQDQLLFSHFLQEQIKWAEKSYSEGLKQSQIIKTIKDRYKSELKTKVQVLNYDSVFLKNLNNAKLAAYKTYYTDFSSLERRLHQEYDSDIFLFFMDLSLEEHGK